MSSSENCIFNILPMLIMVLKTFTILTQFYRAYGMFFVGHVTQKLNVCIIDEFLLSFQCVSTVRCVLVHFFN